MKSFLLESMLSLVGLVAMFTALVCAFATFTTNDYRPIIATGVGLSLLALACFGILIWKQRWAGVIYAIMGVFPSLLALGELLWRGINGLAR